jgi:hypothetical protein
MTELKDIQVGVLHADGTVTAPNSLTWTEMYGEYFVSQKLRNEDWHYFLVIGIRDVREFSDETGFLVEITAVSPEAAGEDAVKQALDSCGLEDTEDMNDQAIAVELANYGTCATLWHKIVPEKEGMEVMAKSEAERIKMLFGFYMDQQQNRIGSTGWDFIEGNVLGGLAKLA